MTLYYLYIVVIYVILGPLNEMKRRQTVSLRSTRADQQEENPKILCETMTKH